MTKIALALVMLTACHQAVARPVLLELFTSQSCSSCPPAEALLASLGATRQDVSVLEFHVDYWNALNWRDPYSSRASTLRQRDYAAALGSEVFTPQLVIDGHRSEVGSSQSAIETAIVNAQRAQAAGPSLSVTQSGSSLAIAIGAGDRGGASEGRVLLVGYDPRHVTAIPSGENGGTVLTEVNVVRSMQSAGQWRGAKLTLMLPSPPEGQRHAVILQADDGTILASAFPA